MKVLEKLRVMHKAEDNLILTAKGLEKETFVHYVKTIKEWEEYIEYK